MGSVFFAALVVIALLLLGILASPLFIIPAVLVAIVALVAGPVLGLMNRSEDTTGGGGPSGVPTTEEASYEPVREP
jgi:hypothetical protein